MTDFRSFYLNARSADPTRTATLRSKWVADWNRRIKKLQKAIRTTVVENDAFGLKSENTATAIAVQLDLSPAPPNAWAYRWTTDKVDGFMAWLREMQDRSLLEIVERPGTLRPGGEPWSNLYVRSAYQRGLQYAMDNVRRTSADLARLLGMAESDLPPAFRPTGGAISAVMQQPFHADRLALAYTRTFDELKNVTAAMDHQISRILAEGIAQGLNPRDIGDKIADRVEKIGGTRGRLIARTETIHVHQQAALNEYFATEQSTGEVVLIEWNATMDSRTRDKHAERHGRVYTKEEAYALIGEPNCRCALLPFIPAVQGMPKKASAAARAKAKNVLEREANVPAATDVRPTPPVERPGNFRSLASAKDWARQKYPNVFFDFTGIDLDALNPTLKKFDELATLYPEVVAQLKYVGTYAEDADVIPQYLKSGFNATENQANAYAHAWFQGDGIGLNTRWYGDARKFAESTAEGARFGWHPRGSGGIESVMTHEFGHLVQAYYQSSARTAFTDGVRMSGDGRIMTAVRAFLDNHSIPGTALSQYSLTNQAELWAEAFTAVYHPDPSTDRLSFVRDLRALLEFLIERPTLNEGDFKMWKECTDEEKAAATKIFDFLRSIRASREPEMVPEPKPRKRKKIPI